MAIPWLLGCQRCSWSWACGCITAASTRLPTAPLCLCVLSSGKDTIVGFGAPPTQNDSILSKYVRKDPVSEGPWGSRSPAVWPCRHTLAGAAPQCGPLVPVEVGAEADLGVHPAVADQAGALAEARPHT